MAWEDLETRAPATSAQTAPTVSRVRRPEGLRRALLTAGIAGALLVTGGVAVVFAASPDPSAPPPSATMPDASSGGSTAPAGGTSAPSQGRQGHGGQPCPDGGNGSSGSKGSGGSGDQSGQPAPDTTAPAT